MSADDRVSGVALFIVSLLVCLGSTQLRIGSFQEPGSGFFPLVLGIAIGILSLTIFIQAHLRKQAKSPGPSTGEAGPKKVFLILLALGAYGLFLESLGFITTTFLLFLFLLQGWAPRKWYIIWGGAGLVSLGSYLIFQLALSVPLPRGWLGF